MTKSQAILYCKEKAEYEGWAAHIILLEIYDDDEDIPQDILDLICYPREKEYKPFVFIMGEKLKESLEVACTHWILTEEVKNKPQS